MLTGCKHAIRERMRARSRCPDPPPGKFVGAGALGEVLIGKRVERAGRHWQVQLFACLLEEARLLFRVCTIVHSVICYNARRGRFAPGRFSERRPPMDASAVDVTCNKLLVVIGIIGLLFIIWE